MKMKSLLILVIHVFVNLNSIGAIYDCSGEKWLNQDYLLIWRTNKIEKLLTIRVEVKTKGWVGFGFSKHGKTVETDMAIGWVDNKGNPVLNDFWVNELGSRLLDQSQDWRLLSGIENETHTVFELERNYRTCDSSNDLEIYENDYEMSNIVFAYSLIDPQTIETIGGPQMEAVFHLNFFIDENEFEPKETDLARYDYWLNFTLPPREDSIRFPMCKLVKNLAPYRHMIVKFQSQIYPADWASNHHLVVSKCLEINDLDTALMDSLLGVVFPCYDKTGVYKTLRERDCPKLDVNSPVRSTDPLFFPKRTGITLDPAKHPYALIEGHIINEFNYPINISVVMHTWITRQIREYESTFYVFGAVTGLALDNWGFIVPPNMPFFRVAVVLDSYCLAMDHLENGIQIFANYYHSHDGKYVEFRHYRNDQMLRSFEYNHYDSQYQPYRPVRPHLNFRKDDKIVVICGYNSLNRTKTIMNPSEHCLISVYFYPKIITKLYDESISESKMTYKTLLKLTGLRRIDGFDQKLDKMIIREPSLYNNTKLIDFVADNKYQIKDPLRLEELQIRGEREQICTIQKLTPNKIIKPPPGLYESIVNKRVQNSCDNSVANKLIEPKVDRSQSQSDRQRTQSFKGLEFSMKLFLNYFKLFFNLKMP